MKKATPSEGQRSLTCCDYTILVVHLSSVAADLLVLAVILLWRGAL